MAHRGSERHSVLAQLDLPCRRRRGLAQYRVHLRKIEIAGSALRQREGLQKDEWDPHELVQPAVFGLDESLQYDFGRQVGAVRTHTLRQGEECQQQNGGRELKHSRPPCDQAKVLFSAGCGPDIRRRPHCRGPANSPDTRRA